MYLELIYTNAYKISTQWFHLGVKKLKDDNVEAFGNYLK